MIEPCRRYSRLRVNVLTPQSVSGRVGFRLVLVDGSDCPATGCGASRELAEHYYSFLSILDGPIGWQNHSVELRGGPSSDLPFWRTGWHGVAGNDALDADQLVAVYVELAIDGGGEAGSHSSGVLLMGDVTCGASDATGAAASCTSGYSSGIFFSTIDTSSEWGFRRWGAAESCCAQCASLSTCRFFHLADGLCYLGSSVPQVSLRLPTTVRADLTPALIPLDPSGTRL